jgi:hypothetical protein
MAKKAANKSKAPKLLAGGNPQIAKGYGAEPVEAYLAAMPGWKQEVGRQLDALIVQTLPTVQKAVKWNTPLYGVEPDHYFLALHCFTKYAKVTFFKGASLMPILSGASKHQAVRYLNVYGAVPLD